MSSVVAPISKQRHALLACAAVIALALLLRLVTQAFSVPSSSMEPTLLPGDHLVVTRYLFREPSRGDVVVFDDGRGTTLVKRIIGIPGDSVHLDRGHVLINGEILREDAYTLPSGAESGSVHVVPHGHFFLLGDNRDHSADSREFGFVPREALLGRATLIYWSISRTSRSEGVRWTRLLRRVTNGQRID